jgi:hypothetical protein
MIPNAMGAQAAQRNIFVFYILTAVGSAAFVTGNWIFFWTRYMTYGELGVIDAIAFAFGLVMEVPTGAIADLLGKRGTLLAAMALATVSTVAMSMGDSAGVLFGAFMVTQLGMSLYSGAAEALAYDTLKERGDHARFDQVLARAESVGTVAFIAAIVIGAGLYELWFRLPYLAWGALYAVGFVACFFLTEPHIDTVKFSWRNYATQLRDGFGQLWSPALRGYLPLIVGVVGMYYMFIMGLVQPAVAVSFGYDHINQSALQFVESLLALGVLALFPWLRRRLGDGLGMAIMALVLALGFLIAATGAGVDRTWWLWWGGAGILLIRLFGGMARIWFAAIANRNIPSEYRATALSAVALLAKLPYVLLAVLAGIAQEQGMMGAFCAAIALSIVCAWLTSALWQRLLRPRVVVLNAQE